MRKRPLIILIAILCILIAGGIYFSQSSRNQVAVTTESTPMASAQAAASPTPVVSPVPGASPVASASAVPGVPQIDLTPDANGLSKATVVMATNEGVIKFKFYTNDAPNTVKRMVELIQKGFYNGLSFHRVVPGFVVQGGDPSGNGTGGSGQKLKAEFNNRRHVEGTVAMARAADPDSADSQFYISLGTHAHLDHSYTVFGQVVEGMDAARKIKVGDKMMTVRVE